MREEVKNKEKRKQDAYNDDFFALQPGPWVKFFRVFWPWQFLRFLVINFKMLRIISDSHSEKD